MDKETFVATLQEEREKWVALLARVGEDRMDIPAVIGKWSVKEVLIHIMVWERWMANILHSLHQDQEPSESELFEVEISSEVAAYGQDEFNEWIVAQLVDTPYNELLSDSRQIFNRLLREVNRLSEAELIESKRSPTKMSWMKGKPLYKIIAGETYKHYRVHAESIEKWLQNGKR